MSGIVQKVWSTAARTYQGMVSKKLAALGLKLEDCYVETPGKHLLLSILSNYFIAAFLLPFVVNMIHNSLITQM